MKKIISLLALLFMIGWRVENVRAITYTTHFEPPHPCIYMNQDDVTRMKDNVTKYAWAQALKDSLLAKADADNASGGGGDFSTYGQKVIRFALAYMLTDNITYAEKGYNCLLATVAGFSTIDGVYTANAAVDVLGGYDLMYQYIKANHPASITTLRSQLASWGVYSYDDQITSGYGDNKISACCAVAAQRAVALGDTNLIKRETGRLQNYIDLSLGSEGMDGEEDEFYNLSFGINDAICWPEAMYNLWVSSNHAQGFDAYNWVGPVNKGCYKNFIMNVVAATMPNGWTTFNGEHVGAYYYDGMRVDRTPLWEIFYTRTQSPLAGWILKNSGAYSRTNQVYDACDKPTMKYTFPPLHHGTDVSSINDWSGSNISLHREGEYTHRGGITVLRSGDPNGAQTNNTLYAHIQHYVPGNPFDKPGTRGAEDFKVYLYGKGDICGWDVWMARTWYLHWVFPTRSSVANSQGQKTVYKELTAPEIKLIVLDDEGRLNSMGDGTGVHPCNGSTIRSLAVSDDYFIDLLQFTGGTNMYNGNFYYFAPLGGTSGSVTPSGTVWTAISNRVKAILFGQTGDNVTFGTNSMLIGEESPGGRSNYSMNWNNMQLRITRGNNSSGTIFKLIIEPVNGTSTIISVAQLTLSGPTATGFKVNGTTYTDYFLYAHTLGNLSGIASGESLKISGRYLYIRSSGTTVTARGDSIKGFTILAPNAAVLSVNGTPADFARKGSYITYPGSGGTAVNTWPDAHPAIRPVMVHPNPMQIVDLAALAANHTITVYDFTGKQVKARDIQKMGIYLLRSGTDGHTSKVILIK